MLRQGAICLILIVPPVSANELDDAYLIQFERLLEQMFGLSDASQLVRQSTRIAAAKSFCEWLRQGETKEDYWDRIVILAIARIQWQGKSHARLAERVFRKDQETLMIVAPNFYCP